MSSLLSVLGAIGRLGILLIVFILLIVLICLIWNKTFPWFRNSDANIFKPSERRKQPSEEAEESYLAALESGEIVAPKVTVTAISLATRTKGVVTLYQITNNGLKELKQKNYCFEIKGMYSAWWNADSVSLSDSPFTGSEKYRFIGVLDNGERVHFCLHERYREDGKSYEISSTEGLGAERIEFTISNLTPNATYLLGQVTHKADENGCITQHYWRKDSYDWLHRGVYHLCRVDNYDFTDIIDIKLSLWRPNK